MAITVTSRRYTDNLRRKRRFLQGRGVNLRETIVVGNPYEDRDPLARIVVPGLHSADDIISVINMDAMVDVTGYLEDGSVAASRVIQNLTFTALKLGTGGNAIGVASIRTDAQGAARLSAPLSVEFSGDTITVRPATDATGVTLADGSNSASLVRAAILAEQQELHGDAWVDVDGSNGTDWTDFSVLTLQNGADFDQGPVAAKLTTNLAGTDNDVRYVARAKGADGNGITVDYNGGAGAGTGAVVTGTMPAIVVTFPTGEVTAQEVVDAVNAHAGASALVIASVPPGQDGTGIVVATAALPLVGGLDPGIQLSEPSDGVNLKVLWLTGNEQDEN